MFTLAHLDVFQPDERIQHRVPGHQLWAVATVADATGIRHQGSGLGEGGGGMAVADQRVFDCALGSDLLWPAVWLSQSIVRETYMKRLKESARKI